MALILIVEDELPLALTLADALEDEGHEVETAPNGAVALEVVREQHPAVIITDFMMPVMTGLELARAVHDTADLSATPIILLSGAQSAIARDHPELFNVVLDKPYQYQTLIQHVGSLLTSP